MKKTSAFLFLLFFAAGFAFFGASARAATPVLSLSATGSGDNVQINVNGDPGASVLFFYTQKNVGQQMVILGTTNSSGYFSTVVSSSTYGIASNTAVYVKTGGINGSQSANFTWPYFQGSTTTGTLTLSQTALLLNIGQTSTLTASANYIYLSSNSNPAVANINFNANQITVQALTIGSTSVNICIVGNASSCATLSVVVQNSSSQQLNFSQNNFSIYSGQSNSVTVTGGSGIYTISSNSNPSAVQASLNGSTVTLTAGSTTGAASITVCTTDLSDCGIINASSTTVNSSAISFSQTNPVVSLGQSTTITIYGGVSGSNFYVSSNSNPSIVQANINNNILTLIGNSTTGSSTINVCAYAGSCGSLIANVSNTGSTGAISLSQNSVSILAGQSANITILGGSTPYNLSAQNSTNIFNGNISGNVLTIYGVNPGSGTASVCSSVGCTNLSITINGLNSTTSNQPVFSQNNILLNSGQQTTVYISGGGSFYVSNNSNPAAASATINGTSAVVTANVSGSTNILICQNGGQCATLYITVSGNTAPTPVVNPITVAPAYVFTRYLGYGDTGADVSTLQNFLVQQGLFSATPNGRYGPMTVLAVKKFQSLHNIKQTGNVGPTTESELNQMQTSSGNSSTTKQQQILQIEQAIQQLETQLAALQ